MSIPSLGTIVHQCVFCHVLWDERDFDFAPQMLHKKPDAGVVESLKAKVLKSWEHTANRVPPLTGRRSFRFRLGWQG